MPLIKSISGIRGTIGGADQDNLTPNNLLKFVSAYISLIKQKNPGIRAKIILGRDGRVSGEMFKNLTTGIILSRGVDVIDLNMASTPTVEFAVISQKAQGGIILTASHNPAGWNALKFLNESGEFLSAQDGAEILELAEKPESDFVLESELGNYYYNSFLAGDHLEAVVKAPLVDKKIITETNFKIVVDGINSVGGIIVPQLLEMLGVKKENIVLLNCEPNGDFAHSPEPLDEHLSGIKELVKKEKADLGIVVDPDVDRLAFIDEKGNMFGEEYTLVAVSDYVLKNYAKINKMRPRIYNKATVSNLSSSRALKDVTESYSGTYIPAAVGEINIVEKMKEVKAVIGGEGNGGIIYPELHYGRDALIGIALFLSALALKGKKMSDYKKLFPEYFIIKDRLELSAAFNVKESLENIKNYYLAEKRNGVPLDISDVDGVKIDFTDSWVHLRASNTEPIIRIYAEAKSFDLAQAKATELKGQILKNDK
jgi:phosphomannomutase